MNDFYSKLAEILDVDDEEITRDSILDEFEDWDSLSALSIVDMIDSSYNVTISSEELENTKTVGNLEDLIKVKITK